VRDDGVAEGIEDMRIDGFGEGWMVVGVKDGAEVDGRADDWIKVGRSVVEIEGFNEGFRDDGSSDGEHELNRDGYPDVCINVGRRVGEDDDGVLEGLLDGTIEGESVDVIEAITDGT